MNFSFCTHFPEEPRKFWRRLSRGSVKARRFQAETDGVVRLASLLRRQAKRAVRTYMPRRPRRATGGLVYHVMNRGARRLPLFESDPDYRMFLMVLREAQTRVPLRLLSYVLMPNHWHLVLWPDQDDQLSRFMAWATGTHARRWHLDHRSTGSGTIYQGRYKAIPVKDDFHFLIVCRYVERNPVAAGFVRRSTDWPWSSAARLRPGSPALSTWPVAPPERWREHVDGGEAPGEFDHLRNGIRHVRPFGRPRWQRSVAARLEWPLGMRERGRPPK